ncbi:DNA-protecting protein DprA [Cryobacterium melibiosiphilum]|uniref:DNA-protecting protein DprA n=1 Tax=Cryobacterium melibiosiphilum TaxID=995039 RepID=A0A3A5MT03_9MICO|nr:DNA-processing protein DprA [Cryobacterium melibiosiphilum]RJT90258.1 DNA-protecting protein DprA [Cryobacterium melibiosiphilum]
MSTLGSISNQVPTIQQYSPDAAARGIWTVISEPGDSGTGELIKALGAEEALDVILHGTGDAAGIDVTPLRARALPRSTAASIAATFDATTSGAELITPEHPHWPAGFNDLGAAAPYALWARGTTEILTDSLSTAVVGARAASGYGEHATMEITAGLVSRGHTIISGAAYGIDGMAHRAALASDGRTVAYLAGGLDRYYPSGHHELLSRIAEAGAVATEIGFGQSPTKYRFLMRNRLIAAAARATVVTEAGWRSGALNIAAHALGINRPVGAVPGPITSPASAGCHRLIREYGAQLVTNAEDAAAL